tara:strand:+ start:1081 stop:1326 length:246 start_codon:yes stop_codon:yes gene_type:complete
MENPKLSKEELQELNELKTEGNDITFALGQLEVQKAILEGQKNNLLNDLANGQERSNKLAKKLQDKYGEGVINDKTGEITK